MDYFTLDNGVKIPCIGTGPGGPSNGWKWPLLYKLPKGGGRLNDMVYKITRMKSHHKWVNTLSESLKMGYRLIDYSSAYENEQLLKNAITNSGLRREDIFIISRASNVDQFNHKVRESFLNSLRKIGTEYLDLYMFHWPVTGYYVDTYKEIELLYKEGLIRSIGVCNCHQHHLEKIMRECDIVPMVNEFEVHPLFTQKPLIEFCRNHKIQVIAYTPLARNDDRLQKNLILQKIAQRHHKTIYQVILRWDIQNGQIPIPRSSNVERNRQNLDVFNFNLSDEEINAIDSININSRLRFDPDNLDFHSVG